jgi:hypothetical protein
LEFAQDPELGTGLQLKLAPELTPAPKTHLIYKFRFCTFNLKKNLTGVKHVNLRKQFRYRIFGIINFGVGLGVAVRNVFVTKFGTCLKYTSFSFSFFWFRNVVDIGDHLLMDVYC